MIFYHYTAREYLHSIAQKGLVFGEVAITPARRLNAVWLTTDRNPTGHGLTNGRDLTDQEKFSLGFSATDSVAFPNKRAIRFSVKLQSTDRKLSYWPKWGRKHLHPTWYDKLAETGEWKDRTWYLYWGTILPEQIREAWDLEANQPLVGWPSEYGHEGLTVMQFSLPAGGEIDRLAA